MSLFDNNGLWLPGALALRPISNGAKFLYMLLFDDYGKCCGFGRFDPADYSSVMMCSKRTLYRYFSELLDSQCIFEERGFYKFYYM